MKYFRRCEMCQTCSCAGPWKALCWLDCHHGHGSFIASRVPVVERVWYPMVANPICQVHNRHIDA